MNSEKKKHYYLRDYIDRLIPDEYHDAGYDSLRKARLFINFTFALTALGPVYSLIYYFKYNLPSISILTFVLSVGCFFVVPWLFKKTKTLVLPVNVLLITYFILLNIICAYSDGIFSPTMGWFCSVPIFAVMLLGNGYGKFWAACGIISVLFFYVLNQLSIPMLYELPDEHRMSSTLTSAPGLILIVLILVNLYESAKTTMLKEIESYSKKLTEHRELAEQAHMRARLVLDSVDQGFLLANLDGSLNKEHSLALETLVGPLGDDELSLWDYLSRVSGEMGNWIEMAWFQLSMGKFPSNLILDQIPPMFRNKKTGAYLSIKCQMVNSGQQVLIVITDISERMKAEQVQETQAEIVAIVHRISKYGSVFYESIDELQVMIDRLVAGNCSVETQKTLLHTLKGSSSVAGMISIPRVVHDLETEMQKTSRALGKEDLAELVAKWDGLMEKVAPFLQGKYFKRIEVSIDAYEELVESIQNDHSKHELLGQLDGWLRESTHTRLMQAAEHARLLGEKLGKGQINITIEDHGIRLDGEKWRPFWSAFSHAVRNAVDHGIENSEIRVAAGKSPHGNIKLQSYLENGKFKISIKDDGLGINWAVVKAKATSLGLPYETKDQLSQALFFEGLSTRESASEFSGRGIGMAALKEVCDQLDGVMVVDSQPGRGTVVSFEFPLDSSYVYAA